jgi:hypothetical protein
MASSKEFGSARAETSAAGFFISTLHFNTGFDTSGKTPA